MAVDAIGLAGPVAVLGGVSKVSILVRPDAHLSRRQDSVGVEGVL